MTTRALPLPLAAATAPLLAASLLFAGCACSPAPPGSSTGAESDVSSTSSPATTGTAASDLDAAPSFPAAAIAAAIAPTEDFTAEVAEISEAGGQGEYAAVANFTGAQGREFEVTVEDSASGQLLANATVSEINSPVHSHSLPFRHAGALSSVVVRIVEKGTGREVDRWSPE